MSIIKQKTSTEITDIINLSLIHLLCTNRRSISVPPSSSKIFEEYVLVELMFHILSMMYLRLINLIFLIIFLSTPDCLVQLIEQITKSLDNCEFAVLVFFKLDLSKAFAFSYLNCSTTASKALKLCSFFSIEGK